METYNCEPTKLPKPQSWAWRAKKQIYKPEFVLNHFVHYSVVTRLVMDEPLELSSVSIIFVLNFELHKPNADNVIVAIPS